MSNWLEKIIPPRVQQSQVRRRSVPEGIWLKCPACGETLYREDLQKNQQVCPACDHHMRVGARERLDALLDADGREPVGESVSPVDSLTFVDSRPYPKRLSEARQQTSETEALLVVSGAIEAHPAVVACFEFEFMGGSMGSVVGERFVQGVEKAIERRAGFVSITASGGARMQEGLLSLMQMAKTTGAIQKLAKEGLPYISVLTDPTMGGVSASFAFVADVVIAEPKALIGFAGPRVIEQTVREKLPEGFQRSEFLLERGAIDRIVDRRVMRGEISALLGLLGVPAQASA